MMTGEVTGSAATMAPSFCCTMLVAPSEMSWMVM
jgi:hypothetical protein